MERLTTKNNFGINQIKQNECDFTTATDKNGIHKVYGEPIDKLAKLEDLMELYHCNSIDDLKTMLKNWDKLKEFITGLYAKAEYGGIEHCVTNYILDKMAKLEPKGEE